MLAAFEVIPRTTLAVRSDAGEIRITATDKGWEIRRVREEVSSRDASSYKVLDLVCIVPYSEDGESLEE